MELRNKWRDLRSDREVAAASVAPSEFSVEREFEPSGGASDDSHYGAPVCAIPFKCSVRRALLSPLLLVQLMTTSPAQADPLGEMATRALAFLQTLTPEQRTAAVVPFASDERDDWHYVPRRRAGLALGEMTSEQRVRAWEFVASAMSERGLAKTQAIIALEAVLAGIEGGGSSFRDPGRYHLLIAGTPELHGTWGWRLEGHHLSLNFTVVDGQAVATTPSFFGANPAEIRTGPRRGERILSEEEDLARELVLSLDATQRSAAVIARTAPREILTGATARTNPLEPAGIGATDLDAAQRDLLMRLIRTYVERHRGEISRHDLEKIREAGEDRIHFVWAGGFARGEGHYYRVQGPTFLLEYDNTQNGANHIHTVWRDFEGDFGRDLLREHWKADHHTDGS